MPSHFPIIFGIAWESGATCFTSGAVTGLERALPQGTIEPGAFDHARISFVEPLHTP